MANDVDRALERYAEAVEKKIVDKANHDIPIAMDYMVDELLSETKKMYNSLIAQFYDYETRSYIRHFEGKPGTRTGSNIYYAFHAKKRHKGVYPYLSISIDADDMAGGYEYNSPEEVMDLVLKGVRWPLSLGRMKRMEWTGSYQGKYFSYRGTPYQIFDSFFENFENIATPIFFKKFNDLGW